MTTPIKFFTSILLFLITGLLFYCNLENFNLYKLAVPNDIIPDTYAPLAYGTFTVDDFIARIIPDATPLPEGGLSLDPINISTTGTSFSTAAIDSLYLVTYLTNGTPAEVVFGLSFIISTTGTILGTPFISGKIAPNTKNNRIQFNLGPSDLNNFNISTDLRLSFTLISPAGSTLFYKDVKQTAISVKITFHAPFNLGKLYTP